MNYIRIANVCSKLKSAENTFSPVVIMAASGWGKTAAVEYYYRRKRPLFLTCEDGRITDQPLPENIRQSVVIIDNAQWIEEEDSIAYVRGLLDTVGIQVLLLTRGGFPPYLSAEEMDLGIIRIVEKDLAFGRDEVARLFESRGLNPTPEEVSFVADHSQGYPRAVSYFANHYEQEGCCTDDAAESVWFEIFQAWEATILNQLEESFLDFALSVCQYEEFTEEMAAFITGDQNAGRTIEYSMNVMSQIRIHNGGVYSFRSEVRRFYIWIQKRYWSKEEILENCRKGAWYYEMKGDIPRALEYYGRAGSALSTKRLLILNASTPPGIGYYIETKEYYFALPGEEIRKSPVLMCGMCMLCSLLLDAEQSDEWYDSLVEYESSETNPENSRREARARIAYLDLCLPHRGSRGIIKTIKNVYSLVFRGEIQLPEMSVTGNSPSIMNGGLDFCEWSKNSEQFSRIMRKPVEGVVGGYSKGLVTIALAESGFENGTMESYEVLTRCNDGFQAAAHGGRTEMCFVSVGVQVRTHILEGQLSSARSLYEVFLEKVHEEGAVHLLPNLEAFGIWISLYTGTDGSVRTYIDSVDSVQINFSVLDQYRQMIKLRALIAENRLSEALKLSIFLGGHFNDYNRTFYQIENDLLQAVILYRTGVGRWRERLFDALEKAAEYHFTRIFAMEGMAIKPLLDEIRDTEEWSCLPEEFAEQLTDEVNRVAQVYPDYLRYIPGEEVLLTKREAEILSMLTSGMTTNQICEECGISYSGLKKHNRSIYHKLGAKNRAEAERRALQLGLVHIGN